MLNQKSLLMLITLSTGLGFVNAATAATSIPSNITDDTTFDLEGDIDPLVDAYTLEFVPLETKYTTSNGNGWRHEYKIKSSLREAMSSTYEYFSATVKAEMSDGTKAIVAQHHSGGTGTIVKLYISDTKNSNYFDGVDSNGIFDVYADLRTAESSDDEGEIVRTPLGTITSGGSFDLTIINDHGDVSITAFGITETAVVEDDEDAYFKFGNYLQSQSGNSYCGESGDSDSFATCYSDYGVTEAKITMTDVTYSRVSDE